MHAEGVFQLRFETTSFTNLSCTGKNSGTNRSSTGKISVTNVSILERLLKTALKHMVSLIFPVLDRLVALIVPVLDRLGALIVPVLEIARKIALSEKKLNSQFCELMAVQNGQTLTLQYLSISIKLQETSDNWLVAAKRS